MADTRAVLIGMGVVLIIVGFLVSNLVCGVGIIFLILGLVIWEREEDDTSDYAAKTSPGLVGVPRRRRRHRMLRVVLVAALVVVAVVGGYLTYVQVTQGQFTGIRISAADGDCWSGTIGSGTSSGGTNVGSCGSASYGLLCTSTIWANLTKSTPGTWTLSVTGYHQGTNLGTDSVSGNLGAVSGVFQC